MITLENILKDKIIYSTRREASCPGYEAHHVVPVAVQMEEYDKQNNTFYSKVTNGRILFTKEVGIPDDRCYRLTVFEHILVHYFLAQKYEIERSAFYCMTNYEIPLLEELDKNYILKLKDFAKLRELGHIVISEKLRGKPFTEEHKHKISLSRKGQPLYKIRGENHWAYGKKYTEKEKENLRKKCTGWHQTEETKKRISESSLGKAGTFKGKKHTEEFKKKLSAARKGENNPMFGKSLSEESKLKKREAIKASKKQVSEAYRLAKEKDTLNGMSWNEFNQYFKNLK